MAIDQLTAKIYNKLSKANLAGAEGKVAVQFNLTGKVTGVFYIEILDGVPSVMPYEYIDHDAIVSGSLTNIEKIFSGKLIPPFTRKRQKRRAMTTANRMPMA